MSKTFDKDNDGLDFSKAKNMPFGFRTEIQALAKAEQIRENLEGATTSVHLRDYGWCVDVKHRGNTGSVNQLKQIHWWMGSLASVSRRTTSFN